MTSIVLLPSAETKRRPPATSMDMWSIRPSTFGNSMVFSSRKGWFACPHADAANRNRTMNKRIQVSLAFRRGLNSLVNNHSGNGVTVFLLFRRVYPVRGGVHGETVYNFLHHEILKLSIVVSV